jgi:hypothetical protein
MTINQFLSLKILAMFFCLPSSLSAQTFSLANSTFGADVDVHISSMSLGADVDVHISSMSLGADVTLYPKVCDVFDKSDVNIYLSSMSLGADIDVHISSMSLGSDINVYLSSMGLGADYTLCVSRDMSEEELEQLAAAAAAYLFERGLIN